MRYAILIGIALAVFLPVMIFADVSDYHYVSTVTITNSTASDVTTRIIVTVPANTLVSNGYIQSDADDVIGFYGSEEKITCTNLTSNSSSWLMDYVTVPAGSSIMKNIYFGDPSATRDQWWIGDVDDTVYAADGSSLDMVSSGTVSLNLYLPGTPTSDQTIIGKYGNYRLQVTTTPELKWQVWKRGDSFSMMLGPNGNGHTINLTPVGASSNYQAVQIADGDISYVTNLETSPQWDYYSLIDSDALEGCEIISVTAYVMARALPPTYPGTLTMALYLNGNSTLSSEITLTDTYTWYSETLSRPGGGSWSRADLDDLELGVKVSSGSPSVHIVKITAAFITVSYHSISSPYTVTVPVVSGTTVPVSASVTGSHLVLIGGNESSSLALSGTLNANSEILSVADCDASINNLIMTNGGTTVLGLTFEPEDISSTTITDHSTAGNNLTYTLGSNPTGISVTLGSATTTLDIGTEAVSDIASGGIIPAVSTSLAQPEDDIGSGHFLYPLVSSIHSISGIPIWMCWMLMYLVCVLTLSVTIMRHVPHMGLMAVSALLVTMLFFIWGLIPWWLVAMAVIASMGTLVMERKGTI